MRGKSVGPALFGTFRLRTLVAALHRAPRPTRASTRPTRPSRTGLMRLRLRARLGAGSGGCPMHVHIYSLPTVGNRFTDPVAPREHTPHARTWEFPTLAEHAAQAASTPKHCRHGALSIQQ